MIGLVQKSASEQLLAGFFKDLAMNVLCTDGNFVGAGDVFAEVGDAEASFTLSMFAIRVNDFRIDKDEFGVGIFLEGDVDDSNAAANADLRGGKPDSVGGVHGLKHVRDKLLQFFVEDGHGF